MRIIQMMEQNSILITGATGFIGSFIAEEALRRGMDVWVAVRQTSSREYLLDTRIHFLELDLNSTERMMEQMAGLSFDYVVHAAGITKSTDASDFYRINTEGTKNLVQALVHLGINLSRFVYISSLSVCGPVREEVPHTEIKEDDEPQPNTIYGKSKLLSEQYLESLQAFPFVILRPTGVYGPREKDYFMMAKSIASHIDFAVGYKPQHLTFVYVQDVVQAVFLAMERDVCGRKFFISDGNAYHSKAFSDLIKQELGVSSLLRIKAPIWMLRVITFVGEHIGRLTGKPTALNNDKYNIMRQRNWKCDITPAKDELGYIPQYDLKDGVHLTMEWYKDNGWIKQTS